MTGSVAGIIVHHRRYPEVLDTVAGLIDAGVPAERVVLIDNSADPMVEAGLRAAADGWMVHVVPNRGYGAAVNAALPLLPASDVVLVLTHEVRIDAASVAGLVDAIRTDPTVGAAGPGLVLTVDGRVWSRGGSLTPVLRLPRQLLTDSRTTEPVRDVDWLDGACVAYRREVLESEPFREDFFLYFEETELHTRLRSRGWRVVAVAGATARQSTHGMPTFWGSRNVVLFQRTHGTLLSRAVGPLVLTARMMAIAAVRGEWRSVADGPRGLVTGYRHRSTSP